MRAIRPGPGPEVVVGSDAGPGWQGEVPPPDEPPPTPFERAADRRVPGGAGLPGSSAGLVAPVRRDRGPRRRRGLTLLLVVVGVALVSAGALVLGDRSDPVLDVDAELLVLLGDIDASELTMIEFDDASVEAFGTESPEDALALVRAAAETAVTGLASARLRLEAPLALPAADEVRTAYLPHLDSWLAYLEAIAEDPRVVLGPGQEPLILRINATAGVFVAALEGAVAAGVGPEVEEAARAILDRGFPDQEVAEL